MIRVHTVTITVEIATPLPRDGLLTRLRRDGNETTLRAAIIAIAGNACASTLQFASTTEETS